MLIKIADLKVRVMGAISILLIQIPLLDVAGHLDGGDLTPIKIEMFRARPYTLIKRITLVKPMEVHNLLHSPTRTGEPMPVAGREFKEVKRATSGFWS